MEIMLLVTRGYNSSYSIRSAMMKNIEKGLEEKKKVMSYMNLNKKVTELSRMGLLEEIKPDLSTINTSGRFRRDYKVTVKGLEQLIFSTIIHKEDVKTIAYYLDRYYPSERHHALGYGLMIRFADASSLLSEYLEYIKHPEFKLVTPNKYDDLLNSLRDIERYEKHPKPKPIPSKPERKTAAAEEIVSKRRSQPKQSTMH